jgi:hypothetical protein
MGYRNTWAAIGILRNFEGGNGLWGMGYRNTWAAIGILRNFQGRNGLWEMGYGNTWAAILRNFEDGNGL